MNYVLDPGTYHIGDAFELFVKKFELDPGVYDAIDRLNLKHEVLLVKSGFFALTPIKKGTNEPYYTGLVHTFKNQVQVCHTEKAIQIFSKDFFLDISTNGRKDLY